MFQDVDCWHESIKNKFNQRQQSIVKEEDGLSKSGQLKCKPNYILIQWKHLDVSVCVVDCCKDASTTTTTTNHPSGSSSIGVNENDMYHPHKTDRLLSTTNKRHVCEHCGKQFKHKGNFNMHVSTHTGERPYSCDRCEFKCAQRHSHNTHAHTYRGKTILLCCVWEILR